MLTADTTALLHAIAAHPDADDPRRMLADELQMSDDPHDAWLGRFIASQLAGIEHAEGVAPRAVLGPAAKHLERFGVRVTSHNASCLDPLTFWSYGGWSDDNSQMPWPECPVFHVVRGLISFARLNCADFMRCARALYARHPMADGVKLRDKAPARCSFVSDRPPWYRFNRVDPDRQTSTSKFVGDAPDLPAELFELLPGGVRRDESQYFEDARAAGAALHVACQLYGRG